MDCSLAFQRQTRTVPVSSLYTCLFIRDIHSGSGDGIEAVSVPAVDSRWFVLGCILSRISRDYLGSISIQGKYSTHRNT